MENTYENISTAISEPSASVLNMNEDYSNILDLFDLKYKRNDPYLQIGEITQIQGWILHVSVVISQVKIALEKLIPVFLEEDVPFKIPISKDTTRDILGGNMGIEQVGKVMSIYPGSDENASKLARKLVELTMSFEGPVIPTDRYLGGAVYARYGGYAPIILEDSKGKKTKFIHSSDGQLIQDSYSVPFQLPGDRAWPFEELASPVVPIRKRMILKNAYMPLFFLKKDIKGYVLKGLYYKGLFRLGYCVIKHGNKHTLSEDNGRTIHDRLKWQYDLHLELEKVVPLPRVIDLFKEEGDTFLVMEYIKCISFYDRIKQINHNTKAWHLVHPSKQIEVLQYLIEITSIISQLHQHGYVHRDIAPGNFLINKGKHIVLVDLELAYSCRKQIPDPPFEYGTQGYISPQQQMRLSPSIKDDVYGLGAVMIAAFVGLSAAKFNIFYPDALVDNLDFFLNDSKLSNLIASCLHPDPQNRPQLDEIQITLEQYKINLDSNKGNIKYPDSAFHISTAQRNEIIMSAIDGLTKDPIIILDDLWYSKYLNNESIAAYVQKEYIRYGGVYEGIGGVLYLLARAKRMGFTVDSCNRGYQKGWEFIKERYFDMLPNINPGLYHGAGGIALSLSEGLRSGLLEDNDHNRDMLRRYLDISNSQWDLSSGIAGQGAAILQCLPYLDRRFTKQKLTQIIDILTKSQHTDGSWTILDREGKESKKKISFAYGIPGITWFLLQYMEHCKDGQVEKAVSRSLEWLLNATQKLKALSDSNMFQKMVAGKEVGDERKGILLTFIKAYEILGMECYRTLVEQSLINYPALILRNDFTQESGLANHGELYLEAFRVFKNKKWLERANWIANVFINTFSRNMEGSGYWIMEERNNPTADLMVGNSGIIHFLLRSTAPEKLGYRLLE